MIPLLVAFALSPPPTVFEFDKPPNPCYRDDELIIETGSRSGRDRTLSLSMTWRGGRGVRS